MTSYETALTSFIESDDFSQAVLDATEANFNGGGRSVELFDDGTYRVLVNSQIGNLYESAGVVLGIPVLNEEDYEDVAAAGERGEEALEVIRAYYADDLAEELRDKLSYEEA
jgi:hypothetical protein